MNKLTFSKHSSKTYKYIVLGKTSASFACNPLSVITVLLITLVLPKTFIAKIPLYLKRVTMGVKVPKTLLFSFPNMCSRGKDHEPDWTLGITDSSRTFRAIEEAVYQDLLQSVERFQIFCSQSVSEFLTFVY